MNTTSIIILVIILILIAVGIYFLVQKPQEVPQNQNQNQQTSTSFDIQNMKVEILKQGTGEGAKVGDNIVVNYVGTLLDGAKFDSSIDRNQPFPYTLGQNMVIRGWELGLLGMKVGEKRKLTIPPELAYGPAGRPPVIPQNATLIFEIDMLSINNVAEKSGITGVALLGPMCPVERIPPDPQCADRPYKTDLIATSPDGTKIFQQFSSDANGKFSVDLQPGEYSISSADTAKFFSRCSIQGSIKVEKNKYTNITLNCDTGIR